MSNRYSLCATSSELEERFSIEVLPAYSPRYNAAPGQLLPVITNTGPGGLSFFYWGLAPSWGKNKPISEKILNVRAELIPEKPSYRKTMVRQRCLVPADGFYEWKKVGKKTAIPYRFRLPDHSIFAFAGLWEEYEHNEESFHTFTIITQTAGNEMAGVNDRMPLIIEREHEKTWLSETATEEDLLAALVTKHGALDSYSISPRINSLNDNDAGLIRPTPPTDQFGNLTLFD